MGPRYRRALGARYGRKGSVEVLRRPFSEYLRHKELGKECLDRRDKRVLNTRYDYFHRRLTLDRRVYTSGL